MKALVPGAVVKKRLGMTSSGRRMASVGTSLPPLHATSLSARVLMQTRK